MHVDARLSRRGFLAVSTFAGAGLIFNVGWLNPAHGDESNAEAFKAALSHMKRNQRPGIAIVVPQSAADRATLAKQLPQVFPLTNLHGGLPAGGEVLLEAVWVCATAKEVNAEPGETLVLLTPEGKRSAGAQADFSQGASVLATAEKLLSAGRSARAKREGEPEEVAKALELLAAPETYWDGQRVIGDRFDKVASAVVLARLSAKNPEVRQLIGRTLNEIYWRRLNASSGFPYAATVETLVDEPEPCPPCGMAMPSIRARKFLGFFSS